MALSEEDLRKIKEIIDPLKDKIVLLSEDNYDLKLKVAAMKKMISLSHQEKMLGDIHQQEETINNILKELESRAMKMGQTLSDDETVSSWGICLACLIMDKVAEHDLDHHVDPNSIWGNSFMKRVTEDAETLSDDQDRVRYVEQMVREIISGEHFLKDN